MKIVNSCNEHEFIELNIDERCVLLYYIMENLYDCEKVIEFINKEVTEQNDIYTKHNNNLKEIRDSIKSVKEKGKDISVKIKSLTSILSQMISNYSWYLKDEHITSKFEFEDNDEKTIDNLTIPETLVKFLNENKEYESYSNIMLQTKNNRFKQLKRRFQAEQEAYERDNNGKELDLRNYLVKIQSKQKAFNSRVKFYFQNLLNDKEPDLLNEAFKYGLCDRYVKKFAYPIVVVYIILTNLNKNAKAYKDPDEIIMKKINDENEDFDRLLMKSSVRIKSIGYDSNGNKYFILPFDSSKLYFCHYTFKDFNNGIYIYISFIIHSFDI